MEGNGSHESPNGGNPHGPALHLDDLADHTRRRVLVVADETFRAEDFLAELRHRGFRSSVRRLSVLVVTPALPESALGEAANDIDGAVVDAYSRLEEVLHELRCAGVPAAGMVGDNDPVVALGDGLRLFDADEVFVIGHTERDAGWAERDLWERLETTFDEEISALIVERSEEQTGESEIVETRTSHRTGVHADIERPARPEAVAGIASGLLGTISLGFLSVGAAGSEGMVEGDIPGPIVVMLSFTIVAFLVSLATTVALTLSLGLGYRGFWQRLIARSTMAFTLCCLTASVLVWAIAL